MQSRTITRNEIAKQQYLTRQATIKNISEDPVLHNRLYLCRNGIPFDVAFSLDSENAEGWALQFAKMDGHHWDWDAHDWKKPPSR